MKKKVLILFLSVLLIFTVCREFPYRFPARIDGVFDYLIEKNENNGNFDTVEKLYINQIKFDEFWYKRFDIFKFITGVPKLKNQLIKFYIAQNKYDEAENMLHAKLTSKYSIPMDGISYTDNKNLGTINKNIHDADTKYWLALVYIQKNNIKKLINMQKNVQARMKII